MDGRGRVADEAVLVAVARARVLPGLRVGVGPLAHLRPAVGGTRGRADAAVPADALHDLRDRRPARAGSRRRDRS